MAKLLGAVQAVARLNQGWLLVAREEFGRHRPETLGISLTASTLSRTDTEIPITLPVKEWSLS